MEKKGSTDHHENSDEEYLGNIWGWKFSFISLGIIVAMLLLMLYRYTVISNSPPSSDKQKITIEKDSSNVERHSID